MDLVSTHLGRFTGVANGDLRRGLPGQHTATVRVAGTGAVSCTVVIRGGNNEAALATVATITATGTDSAVGTGSWGDDYRFWRADVTAISGTNAAVQVDCASDVDAGFDLRSPAALAAVRGAVISQLVREPNQIPFGTYGDSIANFGASPSPWDMRTVSGAVSISDQKPALWLRDLTRGRYRLVYNGGVSGETTADMITRQTQAAGANRKAIADAVAAGVRLLCWSAGVNDFNGLGASATSAQIDAQVATTTENLRTLFQIAASYGIENIWSDINGYAYNLVSADIWPVRVEAIKRLNTSVAQMLAADPSLGFYVRTQHLTTGPTGAWLANLDNGDGLHPGPNGSRILAQPVADLMLTLAGSIDDRLCLPRGTNLVANPDLVASAGGVATGVTINDVGTITKTPQIITWRGRRWQEVQWTTSGVDGNGSAGVFVQIGIDSSGLLAGDMIASELDVYVDDGNGGVPAVFQRQFRTRVNTTYVDAPNYDSSLAAQYYASQAVIDQKFSSPPVVCPATISGTIGVFLGIYNKASAGTVRLRFSMPRVIKLPAGY